MRRVLVALTVLVVALLVAVGLLLATADPSTDVPLELAKALINLTVAVLITGALSYVLTQRSAHRAWLDDRADVLATALQNLKAGYEHVQVARFFLMAQPTARTFNEQIPTLIEARALLQRVQRERFVLGTEVDDHVQVMLDYLTAVADEYRANYRHITEGTLREEQARRRVLDGLEERLADTPPLAPSEFPRVAALTGADWRQDAFHQAYHSAKQQLQAWLDGSPWPSR